MRTARPASRANSRSTFFKTRLPMAKRAVYQQPIHVVIRQIPDVSVGFYLPDVIIRRIIHPLR